MTPGTLDLGHARIQIFRIHDIHYKKGIQSKNLPLNNEEQSSPPSKVLLMAHHLVSNLKLHKDLRCIEIGPVPKIDGLCSMERVLRNQEGHMHSDTTSSGISAWQFCDDELLLCSFDVACF